MSKPLSSYVEVRNRFSRAANIDIDCSKKITEVKDYVLTSSIKETFLNMTDIYQTGTSTFLWTGNYGMGKSSAAIFLTALICDNSDLCRIASKKIKNKKDLRKILKLRYNNRDRVLIPVLSYSDNPQIDILDKMEEMKLISNKQKKSAEMNYRKFAKTLNCITNPNSSNEQGMIIIIDEMGKYLENHKHTDYDVRFWQNLAELCIHSSGRIIFLGILHNSIKNYTSQFNQKDRLEWNKVAGRYCDISINLDMFEQIHMLSESLKTVGNPPEHFQTLVKICISHINLNENHKKRLHDLISKTWPLHPFTTILMADGLSNAIFSQSQRTLFEYINSNEKYSLSDFIQQYDCDKLYEPWMLWDYIYTNHNIILAGSEMSNTWVACKQMVNRSASLDDDLAVKVTKVIGLTKMLNSKFYNVDKKFFSISLNHNISSLNVVLAKLESASCIIYRNHDSSYHPYEGSDFKIDQEIDSIKKRSLEYHTEVDTVLKNFEQRIVARRHYLEKGSLRVLKISIVDKNGLMKLLLKEVEDKSCDGLLLMLLADEPCLSTMLKKLEKTEKLMNYKLSDNRPFIIAVPESQEKLTSYITELASYNVLIKDQRLKSDHIARREIIERIHITSALLHTLMSDEISRCTLHDQFGVSKIDSRVSLTRYASMLMDKVYYKVPIIHDEILNNDYPSTSAVSAMRLLMRRMVDNQSISRLGIEGFPAHGTLYDRILHDTGLHKAKDSGFAFVLPNKGNNHGFHDLYSFTTRLLCKRAGKKVSISEIIQLWQQPPLGIKRGLIPIVLLAYALSKSQTIAYYLDDVFRVKFEEIDIDRLIQLDEGISFRYFSLTKIDKLYLSTIYNTITSKIKTEISLLDVGREMVSVVDNLHSWTKRTKLIKDETQTFRDILKNASDPYKLLMIDMYELFGMKKKNKMKQLDYLSTKIMAFINELTTFDYERLVELEIVLASQLGQGFGRLSLQERAAAVSEVTGDLRLKAFAQRLASSETIKTAITPIASLAINKPIDKWIDLDFKNSKLEILKLCKKFIETEMSGTLFDAFRNNTGYFLRIDSRRTGEEPNSMVKTLILNDEEVSMARQLVEDLTKVSKGRSKQVLLTALAEIVLMKEAR